MPGEIGLALLNLNTARLAWHAQNWGILLYAVVFASGLALVAGLSLWQGRAVLIEGLRASRLSWSAGWRKKSVRRIS